MYRIPPKLHVNLKDGNLLTGITGGWQHSHTSLYYLKRSELAVPGCPISD